MSRSILAAIALTAACGGDAAPGPYDGTVIVGDGYVQVLATAAGDTGCPPRIHRAGTCVRTPTAAGTCADQPTCVTGIVVREIGGRVLAEAAGAYVDTPALAGDIEVVIDGCGGELVVAASLPGPVAPFTSATATPSAGTLALAWQPAGGADQVCGLWTWPGFRELCCAADAGQASFALDDGVVPDSARLSRGVLVTRVTTGGGAVELYRTAETDELLP